jgi:2-polyprenyl-6-methoxyphenol hydroxylase-like FAD-dependent oxidoreductase
MSHAVVMGGSIAGLVTAAALAKNFDRVTVLERDSEPGYMPHRGVPQGHHTHMLLRRGLDIVETLVPGTIEALKANGSQPMDTGSGFRLFQFGSWKALCDSGEDIYLQTRPALEQRVREGVRRLGNVDLRFEVAIDEPLHEQGRVRGVYLRDGELIEADLIVDATGRGSRSTTWLEQWGYGVVQEHRVEIGLTYVSGIFELPPGHRCASALGVFHLPPHNRRIGLVCPIEGNRIIISLAGYHGDHPPTDLAGFRDWARGLLQPNVAAVLVQSRLLGDLHRFNFPTQVRRCYESMRRLPNNYLVVGDAMCAFDPTFAQGMSVASLQAEVLAELRPGMNTVRWQHKLARIAKLPFTMTANEAHRWPQTTGWQPSMGSLQRWWMEQVSVAASKDAFVYRRMTDVMHFIREPQWLMTPRVLARVWAAHREINRPLRLPSKRARSVELSLSSPLHQSSF